MTTVAQEIARDQPGVIVFEASKELVEQGVEQWSRPVQFRFEKRPDGVYELLMRTASQ